LEQAAVMLRFLPRHQRLRLRSGTLPA
jgi:hypothetical protein